MVMAITFGNYDCVGILLANGAVLPVCETELPFILREQKVSEVCSSSSTIFFFLIE